MKPNDRSCAIIDEAFARICDECQGATVGIVMAAFQIAAARLAGSLAMEVGEVTAMQALHYYETKRIMIAEGNFGCAVSGEVVLDMTKN